MPADIQVVNIKRGEGYEDKPVKITQTLDISDYRLDCDFRTLVYLRSRKKSFKE